MTLGIAAAGPETGYGYIVGTSDETGTSGAQRVERFVEKPDRERATELLASPAGAWWNAGIFVWRRDALLASLERHAPAIVGAIRRGLDQGQSLAPIYESLPDVSDGPGTDGARLTRRRGQGRARGCRLERRRLVERAPRRAGQAPAVADGRRGCR